MANDNQAKIDARLARLKSKSAAAPRKVKTYALPLAALGLGIGIGVYAMWPRQQDGMRASTLPTSSVTEFQSDSGLDGFAFTSAEKPATDQPPAPAVRAKDPAVGELTARIEAMEAENRNNMDKLQAQVDAAKAETEEKDRALAEAEAERARLEGELLNSTQLALPDQAAAEVEAQRLADLERRRQEAEAQKQAQINSPMVAFRASGGGGNGDGGNGPMPAGDSASDFLRAGAGSAEATRAEMIAHPGQTIPQGTMIEAALETSVDSSLPGNVAAIVSQDVWSMDMSRILVPRGARLYGRYSSDIDQGQRRVMIAWDRLVRADGLSVQLEGYGTDRVGRSGLAGKVNTHAVSRFGSAALVSVIGALPAALEAAASDSQDDNDDDTLAEIYGSIGQNASTAVSDVMAGYLNRPPTITIHQGAVVIVRVNKDLELF